MRRRGRVCALQILYQLDVARELERARLDPAPVRQAMARYWQSFEPVSPDDAAFAERLVMGVARELETLDAALTRVSQNWRIDRMGKVERNVLRLAGYEILHCLDIPRAAAINEAIEIAKRFSSNESGGFINGILDKLQPDPAAQLSREDGAVAATPDT